MLWLVVKKLAVLCVVVLIAGCGKGSVNTAQPLTPRVVATEEAPEAIATQLERLYALTQNQLSEVEDMIRRLKLNNPSIDFSVNRQSSLGPGPVHDYYLSIEQLVLFAKQYPDFVKPSVLSSLLAFGDALNRCLPDCAYQPS